MIIPGRASLPGFSAAEGGRRLLLSRRADSFSTRDPCYRTREEKRISGSVETGKEGLAGSLLHRSSRFPPSSRGSSVGLPERCEERSDRLNKKETRWRRLIRTAVRSSALSSLLVGGGMPAAENEPATTGRRRKERSEVELGTMKGRDTRTGRRWPQRTPFYRKTVDPLSSRIETKRRESCRRVSFQPLRKETRQID